METQIVDARGLACPIPVVNTKKVLDAIEQGSVTTIVDNEAAKDNLVTLASGMGCAVNVQQKDQEYYIHITKKGTVIDATENRPGEMVYLISAAELGRGSQELGSILMKSLLFTLVESEELPRSILFVNGGVHLACEGSPVLEHLINLEKRGVEILSCGTCLDYYKIKEKLCVGQITNMYAILEKMSNSNKVISL